MAYDIIGDIHGCAQTLRALLSELGYEKHGGTYRHPTRQVIFLGDFVDRGLYQREVIDIVRPMIESGSALSVLGNHEFNAIAYFTLHPVTNEPLRRHSEKNQRQHRAFLDAYRATPDDYAEVIAWFRTLPMWLDLGPLRVVHACWDPRWIDRIQQEFGRSALLNDEFLFTATEEGTWQFDAAETLLKGKEIPLKAGFSFNDKDGNPRHHIRIRWWDQEANTYQQLFMGPESARTHIPDDEIEGNHLIDYGLHLPPCFLGHYWLEGLPEPLAPNIGCVDYSVGKPGGKVVAYRWDGETALSHEHFVAVDRVEAT